MSQSLLDFVEERIVTQRGKLQQLLLEEKVIIAEIKLTNATLDTLTVVKGEIMRQNDPVPQAKPVIKIQPATLAEAVLMVLYENRQIGQSQSCKVTMNTKEIIAAIPATGFTGNISGNKVSSKLWELSNAKRITKHSHTKPMTYSHRN